MERSSNINFIETLLDQLRVSPSQPQKWQNAENPQMKIESGAKRMIIQLPSGSQFSGGVSDLDCKSAWRRKGLPCRFDSLNNFVESIQG